MISVTMKGDREPAYINTSSSLNSKQSQLGLYDDKQV